MKYVLYCLLFCLASIVLAQDDGVDTTANDAVEPASSQADTIIPSRYSVAVLDFNVTDVNGDDNAAIGRAMAAAFDAPLVQTQRFTVVTRADLNQILEEISIQNSGIISPEEAQRLGKISGAEIVVTGSVIVNTDASYTITARFVDVATGQIRAADTNEASNTRDFPEVAEAFVSQAIIAFPKQGQVIAVENGGADIFINIGTETGLFAADENGIISRIRYINETPFEAQIATFTIVETSPQASRVEIVEISAGYSIEVGDLVTIESPRLAEEEMQGQRQQPEEAQGQPQAQNPQQVDDDVQIAPLPPISSPLSSAFARGTCSNLSVDDASALIEVLEFTMEKLQRPTVLPSAQRQTMLRSIQQAYPTVQCSEQVVAADMRRIYQEAGRRWQGLSEREQGLFLVGILLLLAEDEGATATSMANIPCSTFDCYYQQGYWQWGPNSAITQP